VPTIILDVTKIIEDPKSSAAQLGQLISKDQGLVTKILSVANSPLYGIPRRVSTIEFAIVILGFNHIKNIVIALSMMEAFKDIGDTKFDQKSYWEHSLLTATAAKRIADDLGFALSGEVFTAGLLHDLGIPIIYKYFNKEFKAIEKAVGAGGQNYYQAEIEALGVSHNELGELLLDRWNLPERLRNVVRHHHKPSGADTEKEVAALVHLADYMTVKFGIGNYKWDQGFELDENVIDILNLGSPEYLENFTETYKSLFESQIESIKL
jgi:putative nucleotidyltransferase with HDIG domain